MSFFKLGFGGKKKLGVDIGTHSVKIVEASKEGGRFRLENYGLFELEDVDKNVASKQVPVAYEQDLAWGIKETLKLAKISSVEVVASIPSFSTFATVITMPFLSEQDIAKTIPYEARKYIPLPLSEVVLDWSIVNVTPPDKQPILPEKKEGRGKQASVEVYIAAVSKDETVRYQNIMKQAGLSLRALELENSALIRALVGNDLSPIAVVNIGGRSTSILIVDQGFERISHNYEVGGYEITKSIARSLNVNFKRAEELKKTMGLKSQDSGMVNTAMSSLIDLIVFETKKIIRNYEDAKKTKISRVLLIGGSANMPMFAQYFQEKIGLPISLGNPLARMIFEPRLELIKGELNSTFAVAMGLAMREI
jgi:type IV pilus assembly protein PilM